MLKTWVGRKWSSLHQHASGWVQPAPSRALKMLFPLRQIIKNIFVTKKPAMLATTGRKTTHIKPTTEPTFKENFVIFRIFHGNLVNILQNLTMDITQSLTCRMEITALSFLGFSLQPPHGTTGAGRSLGPRVWGIYEWAKKGRVVGPIEYLTRAVHRGQWDRPSPQSQSQAPPWIKW